MRMKSLVAFFLTLLMVLSFLGVPASALETEVKELDVVVIIDTSGSMRTADPQRVSVAAVKMLANMMPAENSHIGIVTFNTEAIVQTKDGNGNPTLTSLSNINNVKYVKDRADSISFSGDTGIGNALDTAAMLLKNCSEADHKKAIILFTDGMDDLPTAAQLSACIERERSALSWASQNECPIYCIGFDYITPSGKSSMGEAGEGITKLTSYSDATGGYTKATSDIYEIEQLFIDMLANICSLYYIDVATIPGDGGRHEKTISINPNVIEANIRISSKTTNAINNGSIELFDPDGNRIKLSNHDNVRYDVDASAASIKILEPDNGDWLLVIDGILGEDVKIGLLEHYNIDIESEVSYNGKSADTLCAGDKVSVTTKILDCGKVVDDSAIYDIVTSAKISLQCDGQTKEFDMERSNNSFIGDFTADSPGTYDITVSIDSRSFHRENVITVVFGEAPPKGVLLVKDFDDVSLKKGESISIVDVLGHGEDAENYSFWVEGVYSENGDDIATVTYDEISDTINVVGNALGSTSVFIDYKDENGTLSTVYFNVTVIDILAIVLICLCIALFILFIFLLIKHIRKKGRRIKGKLEIEKLEVNGPNRISITPVRNEYGEIDDRYSIGLNIRMTNMQRVFEAIADAFEQSENLSDRKFYEYYNAYGVCTTLDDIKSDAEKAEIEGTYKGEHGLVIKRSATSGKLFLNSANSGPLMLKSGMQLIVEYLEDETQNPALLLEAVYVNGYRSANRRKNSKKRSKSKGYVKKQASEGTRSNASQFDNFDID